MNFLSFGPPSLSRNIIAPSMRLLSVCCEVRSDSQPLSIQGMSYFCFPWTANPQRIVALSKLNHCLDPLKRTSVRNTKSRCT